MLAGHNLQVRAHRSLDALELLRKDWEELLAAFPAATTFSTLEWLAPWWRAFGKGRELLVLAFHDDSSRLVGLAPLSVSTERTSTGIKLRTLRLMGDGSGDSDNLDLPVRPGYEKPFATALLNSLKTQLQSWDCCQLNTLPSHSPAGNALLENLTHRGWTRYIYARAWSAVDLPDNWEAYLKKLSSKERGKVGYYTRRLEKNYQARFYKCADPNDLPRCLDALFELHQNRWQGAGEPGSFASAERREFYQEMARGLLARGWLELCMLEINGKPVAAQFGFRYNNTVFALQEGFNSDYSLDAVGYVLRAHVLKHLIAEGADRYDFLAGESESKARWGASAGHYMDIHFSRPWTLGSLYLRGLHGAGRAKERLRESVPPKAWAVLHSLNLKLHGAKSKTSEPG